jgi:hypothetical protein
MPACVMGCLEERSLEFKEAKYFVMVSEHACPLPFVTPPLLSLSLSSLFSYY